MKYFFSATASIFFSTFPSFSKSHKKKSKGIYGNASKKDLMELKEEGIEAQMIPWLDDKDN